MFTKLTAPHSEAEIKKHWKYVDKVYISILCPCFNQENYIRDAIESFLAQECEYRFELIVHDDASTDSTPEILKIYQAKFPTIIKLVLQEENQYSQGKQISAIAASHAQGIYLALCEGDDFWIHSYKIQKQVTYLLADSSLSLVHTGSFDLIENTGEITTSFVPSPINTTKSLFNRNRIRTLTTMFPKKHFDDFYLQNGEEASKWLLGDWPLWIYFSTVGKIAHIPDITSVYRILPNSASNFTNIKKKERFINSTFYMRLYMCKKYSASSSYRSYIDDIYKSYARQCLAHGILFPKEYVDKLGFLYKVLVFSNKIGIVQNFLILRTWLRSCLPFS
ncbi:glycosyltransferase family 2 protein [Aeromonas sp. s8]|uniref:glycosyltransferase family 2 protein n=1 Tax=Aeromonas sp. s8 TaxID=3138489 RepID=UPI0034A2C396